MEAQPELQRQQQQEQAASSFVMCEPRFATVTFVGEDNALGSTFRVPLSSTTTVSRLAKDAMRRLMLSRPSEERHRQCPTIVVTEVYVGGTGTQPKAEVFAQDIVNQVVLVKEEIIYMKLRASASSVASLQLPTPPPSLPPQPQNVTDPFKMESAEGEDARTTAAAKQTVLKPNEEKAACPSAKWSAAQSKAPSGQRQSTKATTKQSVEQDVPVLTRENNEATSRFPSATATDAAVALHPKRPGWGPEAHEHFADNYVSTPGKRPRNTTRKAAVAAMSHDSKKARAEAKPNATEGTTSTNLTTTTSGHVEKDYKDASLSHATEPAHGLRWGPEASKIFPENYVRSPEKLARLARQQQRGRAVNRETAKKPAAPSTVPSQKVRVSRELEYPADASDTGRTTVGHLVEREVISVEEDAAPPSSAENVVELPRGWGADALRYFDPNTYCDDPKKARLMPNMDPSRSTRQRRPTSL